MSVSKRIYNHLSPLHSPKAKAKASKREKPSILLFLPSYFEVMDVLIKPTLKWFISLAILMVEYGNAERVPALFVFGDSLVDVGNNNFLNSIAKSNYFPYGIDFNMRPTGRFSNGKTFVDIIGIFLFFLTVFILSAYFLFERMVWNYDSNRRMTNQIFYYWFPTFSVVFKFFRWKKLKKSGGKCLICHSPIKKE